MQKIDTHLFNLIKLDEMNRVKLMNRTDTKYWFNVKKLNKILNEIKEDYFILDINGDVILPYSSTYYDSLQNRMYTMHHNGKLNRYKIRRRSYLTSGISFLEIKHKNNKGRTIKKRVKTPYQALDFSSDESNFLKENSPYSAADIDVSLVNHFSRITLVNKNFKERCTIDLNLSYTYGNETVAMDNLVIVEVKSEGADKSSSLRKALRNNRIISSGFSKYCIGRSVTDKTIKRNRFKSKLRQLAKKTELEYNLY